MTEITDLFGDPDQEAMYQAAISQPLEYKIKQAIGLIQLYERQALELSPDGYYVCFSGGKDSIVMAKLFEMAGVKYGLHYNNVTIDPPELVRFIKRHYPQAVWHAVGRPLPYMMEDKNNGPPTRLRRWCCETYKEQGGSGCLKATGVRAEESDRRKGLWTQVNANRKAGGGMILCPILYWTDADIWQFIHDNNMPYCELYDQGFHRLGCVGCPMAGKNRAKEFARWPGYERLWKRGFQKYWDKFHGTRRKDGKDREWLNKFNTVDELWNWWMESENVNDTDQPDCQLYLW